MKVTDMKSTTVNISVREVLITALKTADSLFLTEDGNSEEIFTYLTVSLKSANKKLKDINKSVPTQDVKSEWEVHNKLVQLQSLTQSLLNTIQENLTCDSEHSSAYKVGYVEGAIGVVINNLDTIWDNK
jgi:hypothetical protein